MVPNHPRSQLRHTRISIQFFLFLRGSGTNCGQTQNPRIFEFIDKFLSLDIDSLYEASRYPRLFYMWGHAFEFDRANNWEHLDAICEKLCGHGDIWYATNMEIYEYVTAFNSLVFSANGNKIYNPTLIDIYADIDAVPRVIKSGETLVLE